MLLLVLQNDGFYLSLLMLLPMSRCLTPLLPWRAAKSGTNSPSASLPLTTSLDTLLRQGIREAICRIPGTPNCGGNIEIEALYCTERV